MREACLEAMPVSKGDCAHVLSEIWLCRPVGETEVAWHMPTGLQHTNVKEAGEGEERGGRRARASAPPQEPIRPAGGRPAAGREGPAESGEGVVGPFLSLRLLVSKAQAGGHR